MPLTPEDQTQIPATADTQLFPDLPSDTYRFIALDVETANGWAGSICQIGLACVTETGDIHQFSTLVDPEGSFDSFNSNLHGITARDVQGKPNARRTIRALTPLLSRQPLIQHSSFDQRAIEAACQGKAFSMEPPDLEWFDSVRIARRAWPEFINNGGHGLKHLKSALGLNFQHHDAGEDARAAAQVVLLAEFRTGLHFRRLGETTRPRRAKAAPPRQPDIPPLQLDGAMACFCGPMTLPLALATEKAKGSGAQVMARVTTKTTLVVVGDQALSDPQAQRHPDWRRAEEYRAKGRGIRVIGESEFLQLVESAE
ncbi:exonuclease domain-containing protein [Phaeovulum sp. W22_SRMD_FR3]